MSMCSRTSGNNTEIVSLDVNSASLRLSLLLHFPGNLLPEYSTQCTAIFLLQIKVLPSLSTLFCRSRFHRIFRLIEFI